MAEIGERTRGEVLEGIAFQFCKVATVALIAGRWTLPISAGACAILTMPPIKNDYAPVQQFFSVVASGIAATCGALAVFIGIAARRKKRNEEGP